MAIQLGRLGGWFQLTMLELAELEAFFEDNWQHCLFMHGNLLNHGLGLKPHPDSTDFWGLRQGEDLVAVIGCTRSGHLMAHTTQELDTKPLGAMLAGRRISKAIGAADVISPMLRRLIGGVVERAQVKCEPLMMCDLDTLVAPAGPDIRLRRAELADRPLLQFWCEGYCADTSMRIAPATMVQHILATGVTSIALHEDEPAAMIGLSGRSEDMVQLADIYVPPHKRKLGVATATVATFLKEQRAQGMKRALLSSSGPEATRCYFRVGFEEIADYTHINGFRPFVVGAAPC
ncbi:MAG: GNAT family N-acetyltransferase [Paracoccaceae bacterium]